MTMPILATKLYIPPSREKIVARPRLLEKLNEGLRAGRRLTLVSAPAGFGKTTLLSEWIAGCGVPAAWLSLDEGESDPARFLGCVIAALQTIEVMIGAGIAKTMQPGQTPDETVLTALLNEINASTRAILRDRPRDFILALDDYHLVDSQAVDRMLGFLLEHLPGQMHVVIATREDPHLSLARMRAHGQLTEVRVNDLRFTVSEAAGFLDQAMGLKVTEADVAALESRTEGWIAGLQLAAISMQGHQDVSGFIKSFTGSHHFVLDYLVEEVLQQQPEEVQTFLLRTSILERLCGPLCDAVLDLPAGSGQEMLETIRRANLFIVSLDNERKWYRYHHLFGDLLRQRLPYSLASAVGIEGTAELHRRASVWYEANGMDIDAFRHAAAANDVERAERLIEGRGMPLHFRGGMGPILSWLRSLPGEALDARPSLWIIYASVLLGSGQTIGVEEKLQAAERAFEKQGYEDSRSRDQIGRIASTRTLLALSRQLPDEILAQGRRALEYLHPDNLPFRTSVTQTMAYAYVARGERAKAGRIYTEIQAATRASGATVTCVMASQGLGHIQELDNRLREAADTYRYALKLTGDMPFPIIGEAYRGLARVFYQWNDLEAAERYLELSVPPSRQLINTDRSVACEVVRARLCLAREDAAGAAAILEQAEEESKRRNFIYQMPDISALQVMVLLRQGDMDAAGKLAEASDLPLSRARVSLARGDAREALAIVENHRQFVEVKEWADERLKAMILEAPALRALGKMERAVEVIKEALAAAEPGGFMRIFIDEGPAMETLLREAAARRIMPEYINRLLAAFDDRKGGQEGRPPAQGANGLIEPLSERELEVLRLVAEGLSNREIGARLFLVLSSVKGHNQKIFDKLQVKSRMEAVARARELGVL